MRHSATPFVFLSLVVGGCGLEGLVSEATDTDNVQPVSRLQGSIARPILVGDLEGTLTYVNAAGATVEAFDLELNAEQYTMDLLSGNYENGKLIGELGELRFERYVPALGPESVTEELNLDANARAIALMIDTHLAAFDKPIAAIAPENVQRAIERAEMMFESDTPARTVRDLVQQFLDAAVIEGTRRIFDDPDFRVEVRDDPDAPGATITELFANEATINLNWLRARSPDADAEAFDRALAEATLDLQLEGCADPDFITVVFEVNFNQGQLDANCSTVNRDKWLRGVNDAGKRMFFVGGVHEDSVIPTDESLRAEINSSLGNLGGWTPNIIEMFDDGTNGDEVSGDNVWTVSFTLPRGMRMGYKYTWGLKGQLWGGTEEWPGNQRLLEITDVNGDNFVRRRNNFGDESTNKDLVNSFLRGTGSITWDSDANEDGFLDAHELPLDPDNNCVLDDWFTPLTVPPATVDCESLEGM